MVHCRWQLLHILLHAPADLPYEKSVHSHVHAFQSQSLGHLRSAVKQILAHRLTHEPLVTFTLPLPGMGNVINSLKNVLILR